MQHIYLVRFFLIKKEQLKKIAFQVDEVGIQFCSVLLKRTVEENRISSW